MSNRVIPANSINPNATIAPGVVVIESLTPGTIAGIPTNVIGVDGISSYGPVDSPTSVGSLNDYITNFGNPLNATYDMGTFINAATQQGSVASFVCIRVTDGTDLMASVRILDILSVPATGAILTAKYSGETGNTFQATITAGTAPSTYKLTIARPGYVAETYDNIGGSGATFWNNLVNAVNNGVSGLRGPSNLVIASLGDNVGSITITEEGTGYTSAPTVNFTGGGGSGAAGTAVLGYAINSVAVTVPGSYTVIPTVSATVGSGAILLAVMGALSNTVVTPQSSTGSYVPADTITVTGGAVFTVTHTQVVSATIAAGGSGGSAGTQTVTGTTGTGTKFQASVTVSGGGAITAILSITVAGDYTVNPSVLTAEPVTGASLSGATLNIKMGVLTATITTPGTYSSLPTNPVLQTATSGTGTGATFNITAYKIVSVTVSAGGQDYDNTSALTVSGSGSGAGTLTLASTGGVKAITMTNRGTGYTASPTIGFTGGSGTGAAATANLGSISTPNLTLNPYIFAGGTNGNDNVTGTTQVGTNGTDPTGMYAFSNTSITLFALVDNADATTYAAQDAFASTTTAQAVLVGPLGQTVAQAVTAKNSEGITNNSSVFLLGDYCLFLDTFNGGVSRLISPQGFYCGLMGNLSPEQSPLNKQILGVLATQKSQQSQIYSDADIVTMMQNGIEVISIPAPGGSYFTPETGKSAGNDLTTNFVNILRMANFLGLSFSKSGVLGAYIGQLQSPTVQARAQAALTSFLQNLKIRQQIEDFKVVLNAAINPNEQVVLGFMTANVTVQLFSVIVVFLINLEVGTTTIQSVTPAR